MAAADPTLPPEEVALLELGKAAPPDEDPPAPDDGRGDPDATLLWDQRQHGTQGQPEFIDTKRCSRPEGAHDDPEEGTPACPPLRLTGRKIPGCP